MKQFEEFSDGELKVIESLHAINTKLATFFTEVSCEITRLLPGVSEMKNRGYEIKVYKWGAEMYPGIDLVEFKWRSMNVSSGIGLECGEQKQSFYLWVWSKDMWETNAPSADIEALKMHLSKLGFQWDQDEGCYLSMKVALRAADGSGATVAAVAQEGADSLRKIIAGEENR